MGPRNSSGQKAVSLFATCVVVLGGILCCTAIIFASSAEPTGALWICGGCFLGIIWLLWVLRDKPRDQAGLLLYAISWLQRGRHRAVRYEFKRSPSNPPPVPPNGPPTVEQIRELTGGASTWVPSDRGSTKNKSQRRGKSKPPRPGFNPKKRESR